MPRLPSPSAEDRRVLDPDGHFRERLATDRDMLARMMTEGHAAEITLLIHRLAGAAATFGYAEVGELAVTLEDAAAEGRPPGRGELEKLLAALGRALEMSA